MQVINMRCEYIKLHVPFEIAWMNEYRQVVDMEDVYHKTPDGKEHHGGYKLIFNDGQSYSVSDTYFWRSVEKRIKALW